MEMEYSLNQDVYKSRDISVMAAHLFDGYTLVDSAYQRTPWPFVWLVRSDGKLIGLTYLPDEELYAYHIHETDGTFESVCVIPEGGSDRLYVIVNRTINGGTKRYVERQAVRQVDFSDTNNLPGAVFLDSCLTYDGAATSTITGLWHLEGETVSILADGTVHPTRVVSDGSITLDASYSVVQVGLPFTSTVKTMPLTYAAEGMGMETPVRVNRVFTRLHQTLGLQAGTASDALVSFGCPPSICSDSDAPYSGIAEMTLASSWDRETAIIFEQEDPLPASVLSIAMEILHE